MKNNKQKHEQLETKIFLIIVFIGFIAIIIGSLELKNIHLEEELQSKNISLMACQDLLQYEMSKDDMNLWDYSKECKKMNGTLFYSDDTIKGLGCLLK